LWDTTGEEDTEYLGNQKDFMSEKAFLEVVKEC
jgi:hypothetical protein